MQLLLCNHVVHVTNSQVHEMLPRGISIFGIIRFS